jgi:hypothetical protein
MKPNANASSEGWNVLCRFIDIAPHRFYSFGRCIALLLIGGNSQPKWNHVFTYLGGYNLFTDKISIAPWVDFGADELFGIFS